MDDVNPWEWETDSDPEDDPGLVKLVARIVSKNKDPVTLSPSCCRRLQSRLQYPYPSRYMMDGQKRMRSKLAKDRTSRLYSEEDVQAAKTFIETLPMDESESESDPETNQGGDLSCEDLEALGVVYVVGNCTSFSDSTRPDVGAMLTLNRPCYGDFDVTIVTAPPGAPFESWISKRKYRARHVAHASQLLVGKPASTILEDVGMHAFKPFGIRECVSLSATIDEMFGKEREDLDPASKALFDVLVKYGTLQEAIAPGSGSAIAEVLAVWTPDGNDHEIEVVTVDGTRIGVYMGTS